MPSLIAHNCNGALNGQHYFSSLNKLDKETSQVLASSLYAYLDEQGISVAKPKNSDDKIVIGYTRFGLPFQIVVDGFYGCEQANVFSFIDQQVVPLMEQFSDQLHQEENTEQVIRDLIQTIYTLNGKTGHRAEFTLSIAMTYPKGDEIYCAGFGIGDTGLVMKRVDGSIEQLVYHTEVDQFKDAFDVSSAKMVLAVIDRNTIFQTQVRPGDEIVGYTYLPSLLEIDSREKRRTPQEQSTLEIRHLSVCPNFIITKDSLFLQLIDHAQTAHQTLITQAVESKKRTRFGDDFTIGSMTIPDPALCNQIRLRHLLLQIEIALQNYERWYATNRDLWRFFSWKQDQVVAKSYLTQLEESRDSLEACTNIISKLLNNPREYLLQEYLANCLNFKPVAALKAEMSRLVSASRADLDAETPPLGPESKTDIATPLLR